MVRTVMLLVGISAVAGAVSNGRTMTINMPTRTGTACKVVRVQTPLGAGGNGGGAVTKTTLIRNRSKPGNLECITLRGGRYLRPGTMTLTAPCPIIGTLEASSRKQVATRPYRQGTPGGRQCMQGILPPGPSVTCQPA